MAGEHPDHVGELPPLLPESAVRIPGDIHDLLRGSVPQAVQFLPLPGGDALRQPHNRLIDPLKLHGHPPAHSRKPECRLFHDPIFHGISSLYCHNKIQPLECPSLPGAGRFGRQQSAPSPECPGESIHRLVSVPVGCVGHRTAPEQSPAGLGKPTVLHIFLQGHSCEGIEQLPEAEIRNPHPCCHLLQTEILLQMRFNIIHGSIELFKHTVFPLPVRIPSSVPVRSTSPQKNRRLFSKNPPDQR